MKINSGTKILSREEASEAVKKWQRAGLKVVFTNGCFDLLHVGHVKYLEEAAAFGNRLVIGVNSDTSTSALKGPHRPINEAPARMYLLASLSCVDCVVEFDESTPYELIRHLRPDVLVKGGDYRVEDIVGADIVREKGGTVATIPFVEGYSTTSIESRIIALHEKQDQSE